MAELGRAAPGDGASDDEKMVALLVSFEVRAAEESAWDSALRAMFDQVGDEDGCLAYVAHRGDDESAAADVVTVVMYELYRTGADLEAHRTSPTMKDFLSNVRPLLASRPQVTQLNVTSAAFGMLPRG